MDIFYVYGYYKPGDELPFYVGKGKGTRAYVHTNSWELQQHDHFHNRLRAMLADGIKPIVKIIASELSEQAALNLEIRLIAQYGRLDLGTGCLCNHTDGGDGQSGRILSDEACQRISFLKRGTTMSVETRLKMSEAASGKKKAPESVAKGSATRIQKHSNPIESFDLRTGDTIRWYPSISATGYNHPNISAVLRGRRPHSHGMGWRYSTHKTDPIEA